MSNLSGEKRPILLHLSFLPLLLSLVVVLPFSCHRCLLPSRLFNRSPPLLFFLSLSPIFGPTCINYSRLCMDFLTRELSTRVFGGHHITPEHHLSIALRHTHTNTYCRCTTGSWWTHSTDPGEARRGRTSRSFTSWLQVNNTSDAGTCHVELSELVGWN